MDGAIERRKSRRFPVMLSASIVGGKKSYRVAVLDISTDGLLLSAPKDLQVDPGAALTIEAAMIGRIRACVVGISEHGIHLRVDEAPEHYGPALRTLSRLTRAWR